MEGMSRKHPAVALPLIPVVKSLAGTDRGQSIKMSHQRRELLPVAFGFLIFSHAFDRPNPAGLVGPWVNVALGM